MSQRAHNQYLRALEAHNHHRILTDPTHPHHEAYKQLQHHHLVNQMHRHMIRQSSPRRSSPRRRSSRRRSSRRRS